MKCGQQCYTAQRRRRLGAGWAVGAQAKARSAGPIQELPSVLSGTWDFKWPSGTKLRIAFQQLPIDVRGFDTDFEDARDLVLRKLDEWIGGAGASRTVARANLSYEVVADLPAPPLHSHASPRSAKSEVKFSGFVEYDVLVSLLPLPLMLPATEQHPEELVSTSASELGRYAHRIEYGVPTIYLGPQPGLPASAWFSSPDGIFTVVHELGHVLGMPHEQQNPLLNDLPWRPFSEMIEILERRGGRSLGVPLDEFLRAEITERWPGEIGFSDWRQPPKEAIAAGIDSVMAKPSYRCLLQNGHPGPDCRELENCPEERRAIEQLQSPTMGDLQHLLAMYGARVP
jgi:hypothetical protein